MYKQNLDSIFVTLSRENASVGNIFGTAQYEINVTIAMQQNYIKMRRKRGLQKLLMKRNQSGTLFQPFGTLLQATGKTHKPGVWLRPTYTSVYRSTGT